MGMGANISAGLKPLVDLIYPPRCPLCGGAIAAQVGLCADCWNTLEIPGGDGCETCNVPIASDYSQCLTCKSDPPKHSGVYAATLYNDASRKLVLSFKHGGKIALSRLLAQLMAAQLPDAKGEGALLMPVPLHRWRLWSRGFNQAAMLAQHLERVGKGTLIVDGLMRIKRTPSLGGLGASEREAALAGAIMVRASRKDQIEGRDVILVDDVLTSGATSDACVSALIDAGAASVCIACFARVVDGRGMGKSSQESETPEAIKTPGAT